MGFLYLLATMVVITSTNNGGCHAFAFTSFSSCKQRIRKPFFLSSAEQQQLLLKQGRLLPFCSIELFSSFFGSFEEFDDEGGGDDDEDDDEDEDDDDEYDDMDEQSIAAFRSKMGNMFGEDNPTSSSSTSDGGSDNSPISGETLSSVDDLIDFARRSSSSSSSSGKDAGVAPVKDWAKPAEAIQPGVVLLANPKKFCESGILPMGGPSPSLLAKFGLTRPPPKDLGPDRQADLLPVLALVEREKGSRAVLLNRRTGYLLGDLEQPEESSLPQQPLLEKFCIQPIWFGGIDNLSSGLDMLHLCPTVNGATKLTEDGLYWGGDPAQAQDAMEDPSLEKVMTGFDFKFFVQTTLWSTKALDKEIKDGIWFPAMVSKEVLFKSRDRMGTQQAKPLWTEIMELMGGKYQEIKDEFYKD